MSKQLSSVEWLEKAFYTHARSTGIDNDKWVIKEETLDKLFEQAKAMHQGEHKKSYIEGAKSIMHGVISRPEHLIAKAEIYYNVTFGKSENSE